jgi:hypothetical protein
MIMIEEKQTVFLAYLSTGGMEPGLEASKTRESCEEVIWCLIDEHLMDEDEIQRFGFVRDERGYGAAIMDWLEDDPCLDPPRYPSKTGGDYWMIKEVELR